MATKLATKMVQAFELYSKKLATRVTFFWMFYRLAIAILIFFKPEISTSMIRLTEGVDTVMIVNMGTYTANSGTEKVAIAFGKRRLSESNDEKDKDIDEKEKDGNG